MQLQIFKYEEDEEHFDNLTTVEIEGEAWFVASEVCKLLDIKNSRDAVSRLDDDEKMVSVLPTAGKNNTVGNTDTKFIDDKWIMEYADKYFKERDPVALDYLPKLLGPLPDDNAKSIYC